MDILLLIEIGRDVVLRSDGAHEGQSRVSRFLHDVAQRAGQLQLAGALQYGHLYAEHIAPHLGVGQSVDHTHLVLGGDALG